MHEAPKFKELPFDHWFAIAEKLSEEHKEALPDRATLRAAIIVDALGIPSGETSAVSFDEETGERGEREKKRDVAIATYLTNHPGVVVEEKRGKEGELLTITSSDFRDIYPNGLPEDLTEVLTQEEHAMFDAFYQTLQKTREKFGDTENKLKAEMPVNYFRLPGGVSLFLRGYNHNPDWQKNHKRSLAKESEHASVVAIEGFSNCHIGDSLPLNWSHHGDQRGDYDRLMKEGVRAGFNGLFTEVDARDSSKVSMDTDFGYRFTSFPYLPSEFFKEYLTYLTREHPSLAQRFPTPHKLKAVLRKQSTTHKGLFPRVKETTVFKKGKQYQTHAYLSSEGTTVTEPSFLELGQLLFSDALAAVKLHLIARLMNEGAIPKGPILDYEGAKHLSIKSFFLKYPHYAMEVVLRAVNELMAGHVKEEGNIPEIYKVFQSPDWPTIVEEIIKLPFYKVEDGNPDAVEVGPHQRAMREVPVDIAGALGINPQEVMPTDEEIDALRARLTR